MKVKVEQLQYTRRVRFTRQMIRCEAEVAESTSRWRVYAGKDDRCELSALFRVNGKYFCKRHAGDACLSLLMAKEPHVIDPQKSSTD